MATEEKENIRNILIWPNFSNTANTHLKILTDSTSQEGSEYASINPNI